MGDAVAKVRDLALAYVNDPMLTMAAGENILVSRIAGTVNKFGENLSIASNTTEDIWDGGGTYSFPSTVDITHIREATDQAPDRGATIQVQGLDTNWDLIVQDVVLDASNSSTPVALSTPLRRAFRMKVNFDVEMSDDIELRNVGGTTTYSIIQAGNNQTLMAIYTVPNGVTAYMTGWYIDYVKSIANDPDSVEYKLLAADRENDYAFQLKYEKAIPQGGTLNVHPFAPYYKFTEKTDIKVTAEPSAKAAHVHGGFDLILVTNEA